MDLLVAGLLYLPSGSPGPPTLSLWYDFISSFYTSAVPLCMCILFSFHIRPSQVVSILWLF